MSKKVGEMDNTSVEGFVQGAPSFMLNENIVLTLEKLKCRDFYRLLNFKLTFIFISMAGKRSKTCSQQNVAGEDDLEFVSLSHVRELLKTQESTISAMFRAHMEATNKRIDDILVKMNDIQHSLEFTQAEVQDLKKQPMSSTSQVPSESDPVKRLEDLENDFADLQDKFDDLENRSRRNNLCFEGVPEQDGGEKTWEATEKRLRELVLPKLGVPEDIVIERAHRVGQRQRSQRPRMIIARFLNFKDKEKVLQTRKRLVGTNIYINEDFSDRIKMIRKDLWPKVKAARQAEQRAFLRYDKIVFYDQQAATAATAAKTTVIANDQS